MPFEIEQLELSGLILIKPKVFHDFRGFFLEVYKESDFQKYGINERFIQDNHSQSIRGTVRGLHYQIEPKAQGKLVRVATGKVWDVVVDIRRGSPTFLKWISTELSDENHHMLYVPPGFAHGFIALTDNVNLIYKCTNEYSKQHETGIHWNDPEINIKWPLSKEDIIVSEKDAQLPYLKDAKLFK